MNDHWELMLIQLHNRDMEQNEQKLVYYLWNNYFLNKIKQTEVAMLTISYFQWNIYLFFH